jgi:hypothetical protein
MVVGPPPAAKMIKRIVETSKKSMIGMTSHGAIRTTQDVGRFSSLALPGDCIFFCFPFPAFDLERKKKNETKNQKKNLRLFFYHKIRPIATNDLARLFN